jgi:hypothetical protein
MGLIKIFTENSNTNKSNTFSFDMKKRKLNICKLIELKCIFITDPHGENGWETNRPDWDFSFITYFNVWMKSPNWVIDYENYLKPQSYKKVNQNFIDNISDQKYSQILWSIKKLKISENDAFLD